MNMHDDIRLLIPAVAMGVADEGELERVERHVASCADCRRELDDVRAVSDQLPYAAPSHEPPRSLRAKILADAAARPQVDAPADSRVGAVAASEAVSTQAPPSVVPADDLDRARDKRRARRRFAGWPAAATGIAVAACIALAVVTSSLTDRIDSLEGSLERTRAQSDQRDQSGNAVDVALVSDDVVDVTHTPALRNARGYVAIDRSSNTGVLVIRDLPAPPKGRSWQAWSIDSTGRKESLDILNGDAGLLLLPVRLDDRGNAVQTLAITIEPKGGSRQPTGIPVATAQLA